MSIIKEDTGEMADRMFGRDNNSVNKNNYYYKQHKELDLENKIFPFSDAIMYNPHNEQKMYSIFYNYNTNDEQNCVEIQEYDLLFEFVIDDVISEDDERYYIIMDDGKPLLIDNADGHFQKTIKKAFEKNIEKLKGDRMSVTICPRNIEKTQHSLFLKKLKKMYQEHLQELEKLED